jgi:hypothetical protein
VLRVQRRRHLAGLLAHAALLHVPARRHSLLLLLLSAGLLLLLLRLLLLLIGNGALGNGEREGVNSKGGRWSERGRRRSRGEEDGEGDVRGAAGE